LSNWPGKYVIGLTGNIATGKSVVRRMLEHLGAYTIDADALSHRAIAKGAPGYKPAVEYFGKWILSADGEINRGKLGELAFRDSAALAKLEDIIHPLVQQAVDVLVKRAGQSVVVVEAIKLLESELRHGCDSVWITYAPEEVQIERLMRKRSLTREQALQRISAQSPQGDKVAMADVVIRNIGSYDDLWKQVNNAWQKAVPNEPPQPTIIRKVAAGEFSVSRGKPKNSEAIADLINRLSKNSRKITADDIMAEFGDRAYMLLQIEKDLVGVAAWQVENLVARTTDLYLESNIDVDKGLETLISEVEHASGDLQCEASLIYPTKDLANHVAVWKKLGYEQRTPDSLGIQAWTDAALESMPEGDMLFFKQIRQDRILRPI
jgi:dephospho-CoA kinase